MIGSPAMIGSLSMMSDERRGAAGSANRRGPVPTVCPMRRDPPVDAMMTRLGRRRRCTPCSGRSRTMRGTRRREVGHDHVAPRAPAPARGRSGVQRGQGRGARDVRPRTDQPGQGDHLVGHQLVGRHLLAVRQRRQRSGSASGVSGCGRYGPTPIMSRSSGRNSSMSSARSS